MVSIICFELFIICKAYKLSSSHRNIFLGQILLLGLFLCASVSVVLTLTPTIVSCSVVRFGIGVSYALVFASLLVKCVFLISLNSGVYLPAAYQALLLAFSILIQVAISGQWLISNPPAVESVVYERFITERKHNMLFTAKDLEKPEISKRCQTGYTDLLFSLIYVVFLIIFVSVLAIKARHVRNNYRESTYIGLSVGCSVPTWLVWMLSGFLVNERHRDACLALGLLISSFVIFSVMFMSKSRRLIALGSNGVYKEDRDDQFSSISRTGSRYSPSFFHYQPGDLRHQYIYQNKGIQATHSNPDLGTDDGNVYTTLEPTLSSNPNVYFYCSNGVHPGMIY
ncbi:PREDICTED: metabotropic glutamate receptor [Nicrophorus vespilloides]|uniref:Metabotropic glutamate receptor n=1 Tax=Nicrophorus vespilloides TaxID=110193 RepID=A0ABM1N328_NICVS|nr:PREDICTED: metabotropic glutamate receptor [Nicrophorus vespilloides]